MARWNHSAAPVWFKIKGAGEGRTRGAGKPEPAGIGANRPGPSGFRLTDTHFVRRRRTMPHIVLATFCVDRLVRRETELIPSSHEAL